jgi:hypothetical protein
MKLIKYLLIGSIALTGLSGCILRYQEGNSYLIYGDVGANVEFGVSQKELRHHVGERKVLGGAYNPVTDTIYIAGKSFFRNSRVYNHVMLHELIHWTGHPSRLNRDMKGIYEEIIADRAARRLADMMQISGGFPKEFEKEAEERLGRILTEEDNAIINKEVDKALIYLVEATEKNGKSLTKVDWVRVARKILIGI